METLFLTGGTGFIGEVLWRRALAAGFRVQVLTRSTRAAEQLRNAGVTPVLGDLSLPGSWQETVAAASLVIHMAQPDLPRGKVPDAEAAAYRELRLRMDALLLGSLGGEQLRRLVYVAGTSYYGEQGKQPRDEDATPDPRGWGPFLAPAIAALSGHLERGLPMVVAFPGWVYGAGGWFARHILERLSRGQPLFSVRGEHPMVSAIHVEDCAGALLHLLQHGTVGQRYFVVDDRPAPYEELCVRAATALGVPLRQRKLPRLLLKLFAGEVIAEALSYDACLSNARLRGTGFALRHATIEQGIPEVVARFRARRN